jgi:putative ABC transport system permease protein
MFRQMRRVGDFKAEIESHLEHEVERLKDQGLGADEAHAAARRAFGNVTRAQERFYEAGRWMGWDYLRADIRYGLRMLAKSPVFTLVAILTLALGIGANTAIFSLIDAVMLRSLPVQKPEQLVQLRIVDPRSGGKGGAVFTHPLWELVRDQQDVFSGVFSWSEDRFDLAQGGAVQYISGIWASGGLFQTLGLRPAAGRLLSPSDDRRGCPGVAVLSYGFWQAHYGGAESAIGGSLSLNQHSFQIIGVAPPGFYGLNIGSNFDVAVPICASAAFDAQDSRLDNRSYWWLWVMGRIRPGVSTDQLKARLALISPHIFAGAVATDWGADGQAEFRKQILIPAPAANGTSAHDYGDLQKTFAEPLRILMAVAGLVLLIACANIASLMLARAAMRRREMAVRRALGSSRSRLIRQLLTECLLLSCAGAALGILFARWGNTLLVRLISTARSPVSLDFALDGRVLAFTIALAVLTALLFGILPAVRSARVSLTSAMKGSQAADADRRVRFRLGKCLVGSQVALCLVLLVVAGLFLRSFWKLSTLDIGFDRDSVLLVTANLDSAKVPQDRMAGTFVEIGNRLRALPGVISVSRSIITPLSGMGWNGLVHAETPDAPKGRDAIAFFNYVSPAYFQTLRTPLLAGRSFGRHDISESAPVAIVDESVARKFFPQVNPIGRYFRLDGEPGKPSPTIEVVGLVKDAKYGSMREENRPTVFFPITQIPGPRGREHYEIRTAIRPSALAFAVQNAVAGVNKGIPLEFHTLAEQVADSLVQERMLSTLAGFFGGLALLLAALGLYGAIGYLVNQRQTEFGVRMALGAQPRSIVGMVLRDVAAILVGGAAGGIIISLAFVRVLQNLLFGLAARDLASFAGAIVLLSTVAFTAGYLPARRATQVDPIVALKYE